MTLPFVISLSKKKNVLHNSQSEKYICCIWGRFYPRTNENKPPWNSARLIFRKFRSPEDQSSTKSKASPVLMLQQIHNGLTQAMTTWLQLENITQIFFDFSSAFNTIQPLRTSLIGYNKF